VRSAIAALVLAACGGSVSPGDGGRDAPLVAADTAIAEDAPAPAGMLLHAEGATLVDPRGAPVPFLGAISCCGGAYGWPIFDEAWIDYAASHGATFLHARLGPFMTWDGAETEWAAYGGGYASAPDGRADLSRWNEAFWSRLRDLVALARSRGMWVEIDVADGWAIRHCRAGDIPEYSAWSPANNVQGEDACDRAGREAPGPTHEAWIRRVVEITGAFDHVVYQDGNEIALAAGYDPAWTTSMLAIVRDEEASRGYPRHLFGTNSERADVIAAVDFAELHTGGGPGDPSLCAGRPCLVNEYNPDPPLTPAELHANFCAARAQGTYFWYWRHGQDAAAMDATLDLVRGGCGP
jgi:hypothetical protein